jgi:hypothetical protein
VTSRPGRCPALPKSRCARGKPSAKVEGATITRLTLILVLVGALTVGAGAHAGGIADQPCPNVAGEHTNTCPPGKVGAPYSVRFVETEGSGCGPDRQTFHFDSGELPPELTLAPDGNLSGMPTQVGTFRFYVEMREPLDDPAHCAGKRTQKQFTLTICRQLGIVSSAARSPRAEVGFGFQLNLSFCGGMGEVDWTVPAGALPAGLALRPNGTISGTPRAAGTHGFTVRATDTLSRVAEYAGTITVAPRLRVRTERLPVAMASRGYRAKLASDGGAGAKLWSVERGRLPRGVRLDPARGIVHGAPRLPGEYRILVSVTDGLGVEARRALRLRVDAGPKKRR